MAAPSTQPALKAPPTSPGWWLDLYLAAVLVAAFAVDQVTKHWIQGSLPLGISLPAEGFFRITHVTNTGIAFGLFPHQSTLLIVASLVGITVLLVFFRRQPLPPVWLRTSLGLQLGGAAGNLADRLTLGTVVDFIQVGIWPVFNLADTSIVVGLGILAWFLVRAPKGKPRDLHSDPLAPLAPSPDPPRPEQ